MGIGIRFAVGLVLSLEPDMHMFIRSVNAMISRHSRPVCGSGGKLLGNE